MNFQDVKAGQVVRFKYAGGSKPGHRLALAIGHESGASGPYLAATDLEINDRRNFSHNKVSDVKLVADVGEEIVRPSDVLNPALAHMVPTSILIDAYNAAHRGQIRSIRYDGDAQVLVVRKRYETGLTLTVSNGKEVAILFRNTDGKEIGIRFTAAQPIDKDIKLDCILSGTEGRTFAAELFEHFNRDNAPSTPTVMTPAGPQRAAWKDMISNANATAGV